MNQKDAMSDLEKLAELVSRRGAQMPVCLTCDRSKYPIGRSIPMEVGHGVYCTQDCTGYRQAPGPDNLYPGELTLFEWVKADTVRDLLASFTAGEEALRRFGAFDD